MQLPNPDRVVYRHSPLQEVICQLRFPTILRIETEIPSEFQDAIRGSFPFYDCTVEQSQSIEMSPSGTPGINAALRLTETKNHAFSSAKGTWRINLTSTFLSLSTRDYTRWEDFKEQLKEPLLQFISIYQPSFFTRIGLRYVDAIDRPALGLTAAKWSDLLADPVLGLLGTDDGSGIRVCQNSQIGELQFDDGRAMTVQTGLGTTEASSDPVFVIDADTFINGEIASSAALSRLDALHDPASRFFRWAVSESLHRAMEPTQLEV